MSGIIGHLTYAILAHQIVLERAPQIARLISDHQDSYLAGAYLGADVMTRLSDHIDSVPMFDDLVGPVADQIS